MDNPLKPTTAQLHILQHAIGADEHGRPKSKTPGYHRNHFVTGEGSKDFADCVALVERGWMSRTPGNAITGGADVFRVTEAGRRGIDTYSPPPPKQTRSQKRYDAFLEEDSDMRFGDWLRAQKHRRAARCY
jgi:hypothetical protein